MLMCHLHSLFVNSSILPLHALDQLVERFHNVYSLFVDDSVQYGFRGNSRQHIAAQRANEKSSPKSANAANANMPPPRVVVHLDLDCFYAQVEQRRLRIHRDEPVAVQQWGSLLAINYAARKFGISRGDNVNQAIEKCPQLHVPHVELLGENRKPHSAYDRTHQKAILRRYRVASKEIYEVLRRSGAVVERAGIDESFLDVTELEAASSDFCSDPTNEDTKVVGITPMEGTGKEIALEPLCAFPLTDDERWLSVGASITRTIRQNILDELGFTCSVGIATNKLVAKLASPLNKPAGQTILAPRFFGALMDHFPLRKIRGLGGKLGRDLMGLYYKLKGQDVDVLATNSWGQLADPTAVGVKPTLTVRAFVESCSYEDMVAHLGRDTAAYVRGVCNGDDGEEPVNAAKIEIKTFTAAKQYDEKSRLQHVEQLQYWLPILAEEVLERCEDEKSENKRFPSQVCVSYTRVGAKPKSRNISISLDASIESIVKAAMAALQNDVASIFPCAHLSIHIKDFMAIGSRSASISTYFSKTNAPSTDGEHPAFANDQQPAPVVPASNTYTKRKISSFFRADEAIEAPLDAGEEAVGEIAEAEPSETSREEPFFCEACDKFVYESKPEHADFHFALKLSKAFAPVGEDASARSTEAATGTSAPPQKKQRQGPMDAFLAR